MAGTGRVRYEGVGEEVSGGIGQIGGDRRGGGNVPRNDDGPVIREGVKSSNLTY